MKRLGKLRNNFLPLFFRRQCVFPFDTVFGFFCVYSGLVAFFGWGIVNDVFLKVLGSTVANLFNFAYVIAGLCLYFGIGLDKVNFYALGLILISMSLIIRSIAVFYFLGLDPTIFNNYVFSLAFLVACGVRIWNIMASRGVIEVDTGLAIMRKE